MANTMRDMQTIGHDSDGRTYVQLDRDVYTYTPNASVYLHWLCKRAAFESYLRAFAVEFTPAS
jgi:hypothetical protein